MIARLPTAVRATVTRLVSSEIASAISVAGGDINSSAELTLSDGRKLFLKFNPTAPADLFEAEALGLSWLGESDALVTPRVVAHSSAPPLLVLEYIQPGRPGKTYAEVLGRGLARLHATAAGSFGALPNNYIGTLPQDNTTEATFVEFYWRRRIEPQLRRAFDSGALLKAWLPKFDALASRLPALLTEPEQPERVHGDLWAGNVMCDAQGAPVIIDPAAYGGHGEVDLAMMRLFGGFDAQVEAAYLELRPAPAGLTERLRLLQLYPLLVHANLFGGAYALQVASVLTEFS